MSSETDNSTVDQPIDQGSGDSTASQAEQPADNNGTSAAVAVDDAGEPPTDPAARLSRILAMNVPVIVKIAQKKISFSDVLRFHIGTVIQFDKDPYQYVDLMVNNSKIGAGQPVKVAENFGLKVMQIGPIADTIRSLGGGT